MRMFQSASGHSSEQSTAYYSSWPSVSQLKGVSDTISNWFENQVPPPQTLLSVQNLNRMASRLTTVACFPRVFFQLLQYSRQHARFSAHCAALTTKTDLSFPTFSLRFVDFLVQFCLHCKFSFHSQRSSQVWQWRDFPGPITIQWDCFTL